MTAAFSIRIPVELLEQIKALAKDEHRSVNAQIIHILQARVNT